MNQTKIEWVKNPDGSQGYTWNPITGCLNGCEYCYASKLAYGRLRDRYLTNTNIAPPLSEGVTPYHTSQIVNVLDPFYPRFWSERLWDLPVEPRAKPRGIFVCDMSDLFGIGIPKEWTDRVLARLWWGEQHRYYLLTKQPQNLIKFPYLHNCWVGVTATGFKMFVDALAYLLPIKARLKYISFEPLLSWDKVITNNFAYSNELGHSFEVDQLLREASIKWVIIGGQTKPLKLPNMDWVREIITACNGANIPVFIKNNILDNCQGDLRLSEMRQEMPR